MTGIELFKGDYDFIGICLFVSRIMLKIIRHSHSLVERWLVGHGRSY